MNRLSTESFGAAILATHSARADLIGRERVTEKFDGETVWEGEVLVFRLLDHPQADRCYAWELDGDVTCVLGVGPVKSAADAVRAAIMSAAGATPEAG